MEFEPASTAPLTPLRELASRFGVAQDAARDGAIAIAVDGLPVHVAYTLRSAGSTLTQWTTVGVKSSDMPGPHLTWHIAIRPTDGGDAGEVRAGRLRDIVLGDPPFDEAFLVEAAPEDAIRAMLDEHARSELLALLPLYLQSTKDFGVEITRKEWTENVDTLERIVRLVARLAASLSPGAHEAGEARRRASARGYRDAPLTSADIEREREADLRAFNEQRERRRRRERRIAIVALAVALLAVVGMFWGIDWLGEVVKASEQHH
jgi:hypothetical protein